LVDRKAPEEAAACAANLIEYTSQWNRRSLDQLTAKAWYYYALTAERLGIDRMAQIRNNLLLAHRTCCLRHDEPGQAVLINCLLRSFLASSLFAQADRFRLNATFPENRSNSQHSRYLYYTGQIQTVQLHYSDAYTSLSQCLRRAPATGGIGFRQQATKLFILVQLLMGDIPDRSMFRQVNLKRSLKPYFQLTQAVRVGNLAAFQSVVTRFELKFIQDKVLSLINRLRHNVIKTGLRRINLSYSRISIRDICARLHLDSEEDAEYIVAKAIHDGVIDATIDRKQHFVFSKETADTYSTSEPQQAFHKRISFCLDVHNQAVRDMRYPPDAHKPQAELQKQQEEADLAAELEEGDKGIDDD